MTTSDYIDIAFLQEQISICKNLEDDTSFTFAKIPNDKNNRYQCCCVDCNRPATHHHKSIQNLIIGSYCEYCKRRLEAYSLDNVNKSFKKITIKKGKLKK